MEIYDQDDNAADTDPDIVEVYFDEETNGEKNICRTCAQPTDDQTSKHLFQSDNYMILQQITDLTELIVSSLFFLYIYYFMVYLFCPEYSVETRGPPFEYYL